MCVTMRQDYVIKYMCEIENKIDKVKSVSIFIEIGYHIQFIYSFPSFFLRFRIVFVSICLLLPVFIHINRKIDAHICMLLGHFQAVKAQRKKENVKMRKKSAFFCVVYENVFFLSYFYLCRCR